MSTVSIAAATRWSRDIVGMAITVYWCLVYDTHAYRTPFNGATITYNIVITQATQALTGRAC